MREAEATHVDPRVAAYAREADSPAEVLGRFRMDPALQPAVEAVMDDA